MLTQDVMLLAVLLVSIAVQELRLGYWRLTTISIFLQL